MFPNSWLYHCIQTHQHNYIKLEKVSLFTLAQRKQVTWAISPVFTTSVFDKTSQIISRTKVQEWECFETAMVPCQAADNMKF